MNGSAFSAMARTVLACCLRKSSFTTSTQRNQQNIATSYPSSSQVQSLSPRERLFETENSALKPERNTNWFIGSDGPDLSHDCVRGDRLVDDCHRRCVAAGKWRVSSGSATSVASHNPALIAAGFHQIGTALPPEPLSGITGREACRGRRGLRDRDVLPPSPLVKEERHATQA